MPDDSQPQPTPHAELERLASAVSPQCGPVAPIKDTPLTAGELREALARIPDDAPVYVELPVGDDLTVVEGWADEGDWLEGSTPEVRLLVRGTRAAWYRRIAGLDAD